MSLFAIDLQAAPARAKQAKQQCDGHPTAERVVAEVVKGLERDNGPDVSHGRGGAVDEVGKSGVLCPDEPPDDAKCDRRQHAISGIGMQQAFVVAACRVASRHFVTGCLTRIVTG